LNLLDEPSPWILTLPAVTTDGTSGIATPGGPHTWAGPWVFYFAMPDASTSLTPGPLPTLLPATVPPTDLPGAVPTYAGPLLGPVPPTSTAAALALTPTLPVPPSDCEHPAP